MSTHNGLHILIIASWYPTQENPAHGSFFQEQATALTSTFSKVGAIGLCLRTLRGNIRNLKGKYGYSINEEAGIPILRLEGINLISPYPSIAKYFYESIAPSIYKAYTSIYGKPDVIQAQSGLYGGLLASIFKKKYGIPFFLTEHNTAMARGLTNKGQNSILNKIYRDSEYNTAVSDAYAKLLNKKYHLEEKKKFQLLPNPISNIFSDLNHIKTKQKPFRFISIGFLQSRKNHIFLIKCINHLKQSGWDCELVIGGDGPEKNRLHNAINQLNLNEQVHLKGALSRAQVLEEMRNSDCYIHSSQEETFGVVIAEALSQGLPVITSATLGSSFIINQKELGLIFEQEDLSTCINHMIYIMKNYQEYNKANISAICRSRFSSERYALTVSDIARNIIQ